MRRVPIRLSLYAFGFALSALPACDRGGGESVSPPDATPTGAAPAADDGPLILSEWSGGKITGLASRAAGAVDPPAGSSLQVMLWGGAYDTKIVAQTTITTAGPSPWAFELELPEAAFEPTSGYGVSAVVNDPEGNVWFSTKPVAVWRVGEPPRPVELTLDPMDPRAAATPAP